jgi:hypothetical protein
MKSIVVFILIINVTLLRSQSDINEFSFEQSINSFSAINSFENLFDADLIFYGFIHGAELPQIIETNLLKELIDNNVKYYAPEVTMSQAFFINKFLETGNDEFLIYVLQTYNAPQDASIQWINKFSEIRKHLYIKHKNLEIIGTDMESSEELMITYLSHLLKDKICDLPIIDSLKLYKKLEKPLQITSMGPLYKLAKQYMAEGKDVDAIFHKHNSQNQYSKRLIKYYYENKNSFHKHFGIDSSKVIELFESYSSPQNPIKREACIIKNFENYIIPMIEAGNKVYSNFGYAHVLQSELNSKYYLAATLKNNFPHLKIYTILSHLAESEVLYQRKYCKSGKIKIREKKIKTAKYCGAVNSKELDGDSEYEKVKGIEELTRITKNGYIRTIDIHKIPESLSKQLYYIDYAKNKNPNKILIDNNLKTLDYYQALIFINGSKPNTPYEITDANMR